MKSTPILFIGPMVRLILEGRKTQTRRIIKPQPPEGGLCEFEGKDFGDPRTVYHPDDAMERECDDSGPFWKCPYGQPGDRLWVRETWQECLKCGSVEFLSDCNKSLCCRHCDALLFKWKPSIHIPRWASRIDLEIISVRVERLNDISEEDAKAEGALPELLFADLYASTRLDTHFHGSTYKDGFRFVWESINGPGSWDANPWVWRIEFRKL